MEGLRAGRWIGAVVVAVVALAGCGDPDQSSGSGDSVASAADADEVVAAAAAEVLGDGPFRSRTTGGTPFIAELDSIYEQSGDDVVDIAVSDGTGSATVISGNTAYEWDATSQGWTETPLEMFDPLLGPGFLFGLALIGLFDVPDSPEGEFGAELESGMPPVATGWTEVDGAADGMRRFERALPSALFADQVDSAEGVPVERLEEAAITGEFYRSAEVISSVEVDSDGNLASNSLRVVFDGSPDYPDCAPMARHVGTTEMVTEFSDVGADFTITVPDPAQLVAEFPLLGETPDFSDVDDELIDGGFRNEAGERDLSGCPTPDEQPPASSPGSPVTSVESCQIEGLTIRTAVLAHQADSGQLPESLDDLDEWLLDPPSDEWTYEVSGDDFELDGPCDLP